MTNKGKILLAEDDYYFAQTLKKRLEEHGFDVELAADGEMAWKMFKARSFDICLLDIVMPKKDGLQLAHLIRLKNSFIPILFLTAKSRDEDVLTGFKSGADGYIKKPFSMQELLLRIEVFMKRTKPLDADKAVKFKIGSLTFNYPELQMLDSKGDLQKPGMTQREADFLKFLCENVNKVIKREEILYHVWGKDDFFLGRSMDVFVVKLRKRFEKERNVELVTLHGVGFKFEVQADKIVKVQ